MHHMPRRLLLPAAGAAAILQLSCGREITGPANGVSGRVAHIALDAKMPFVDSLFESALGISSAS